MAAAGFLTIGYTGSLGAAFAIQAGILCAVTCLILTRRKHKGKTVGVSRSAVDLQMDHTRGHLLGRHILIDF